MKQITRMRKVVCIMANELKKAGFSLSQAFKFAVQRTDNIVTRSSSGSIVSRRYFHLQGTGTAWISSKYFRIRSFNSSFDLAILISERLCVFTILINPANILLHNHIQWFIIICRIE